jgi:choline-sulfatase
MFTLLWLAACMSPPVDPRPSVLLITLDTTRADHLGCYGYAQAETPTYDALAAAGTRFDRATSSCPLTIPSHSTILTGRFPPSHGVRDNGDFTLGDEAITLAERFKAAGWATAAFTSAFPTHRRWGFSQGFDVYQDPLPRDPSVQDWRDQRTADDVVQDVLRQLPHLDGPVFMWVHLFDAHWPYAPPQPFASRHPGRPYDGEIAFADSQVARLLEAFNAARPDPVVLITADHGEGLGDGGEQTHGFLLHDGTLHVPMILSGRGVPAGKVVDTPVSHVDIAPTLLNLAGLPLDDTLQGKDLLQGGSGEIYSEALTGQFQLGLAPLRARTDADGRFTSGGFDRHYTWDGRTIAVTPDPTRDLTHERALFDALTARLEQVTAPASTLDADDLAMLGALGYIGTGDVLARGGDVDPQDVIDVVPLTWQARQALGARDLARARAFTDRLRVEMGPVFGVRQIEADLLEAEGRIGEAIDALTQLHDESPSSTLAQRLGDLFLETNDPREAEAWFNRALDELSVSSKAMAGLVRAALALGEPERADELARRFLHTFPDQGELHVVLAESLLADHRPADAAEEAGLALKTMPWSAWALSASARALWDLGRPDPAIDRLQQILVLHPFDIPTRTLLAEWLLEVGRRAEAVRTIGPMARLLQDDPAIVELAQRAQAALDAERNRSPREATSPR